MVENVVYFLLFLSVIIYAFSYFRNSFEIDLKFFVIYLGCVFSFEIIALYLHSVERDNLFLYNILTFLEFNCLLFFLKEDLELKSEKLNIKLIIKIFNIIYVLSSIYYLVFESLTKKYNSIASISGSVLLTIALFLFFKAILNSNKILNYKKSISFWIAFGLLVYYLGTIPITSIMNYMSNLSKEIVIYLFNIQIVLSYFMYSCFIFGVLWSHKKVK